MTPLESQIADAILSAVPLEIEKSEITAETSFKALDISSMEIVNVLFELEEQFKINIEAEEMFRLQTLADIARFIEGKSATLSF